MFVILNSQQKSQQAIIVQVADEADREKAHSQFAKVRKAYEVLRSPDKRKQYDNGVDPT